MKIGIIWQPINHLFGKNNGILNKLLTDGWEDKCKNKIKSKDKKKGNSI